MRASKRRSPKQLRKPETGAARSIAFRLPSKVGSCRLPAAACGVVGFKGTYGLVSTQGILEGEKPPDETIMWLSHAAITTRSVEDTALVLDVLMERNEQTKTIGALGTLPEDRELRIGVANNFKADQQVRAAFEKAVDNPRSRLPHEQHCRSLW